MVKFNLLIILILLLPLISGNGLQIEQSNIWINKTYGEDFYIKINVTNEDSFKFYNVTFFEDEIIKVDKFDLSSGEKKEINITIIGNDEYKGLITLRGEYYTTIGSSNKTEEVIIDYDDGLSKCNIDIIKGDKINWINNVLGEIEIVNYNTEDEFLSINEAENKTYNFNNPTELNYYARWIGFKFTEVCKINVMNDNGLVHKLDYDSTINLDLNIIYEPTILQKTFYTTDYEISYNGEKEDIFKIKNVGTKSAKNVKLSGEWFNFNENNFDLGIGEEKNVEYTINPIITNTNQTNKTYNKIIKIEGNFNTIEQNINIFIPYKNVNIYTSGEVDNELIENFIKYWCFEDIDKCIDLFCSIYPEECNNGTFGSGKIMQEFSQSTIQSLIEGYAKSIRENEDREKTDIQTDIEQTNTINETKSTIEKTQEDVRSLKESIQNLSEVLIFSLVFILFLITGFFLYHLILNQGFKDIMKNKLKFHKGERSW